MKTRESVDWSAIRERAAEKYRDLFPERQIYFRSKGVVRFVSLSPRFQASAISTAFALTCWLGIASASLIFGNEIIERKEQQIADLREIREDLHGQLVKLQDDLIVRAESLQARQQVIDQLLDQSQTVLNHPNPDPAGDPVEQAITPAEGEVLPVGGPASEADETPEDAEPTLEDEVSRLEALQHELIARLDLEMQAASTRVETALSVAGVKLDDILAQTEEETGANQGGPLNPIVATEQAESEADSALLNLIETADHLSTLETILATMPLAKPVSEYYISSDYGRRRDPFSKRWAYHSGVDMAHDWKTPVFVTAPGTVTFVGRSGAYGRMIEIDHGNGFSTRYGHLSKIVVEKGVHVALGDRIGLMGSTGRSTGTHLHYEVRFNGAPLNPLKFFEAATYVQTTAN